MTISQHSQSAKHIKATASQQREHQSVQISAPDTGRQGRSYGPQMVRLLRADLHSERVLLVPLRVFIALGWLRAGVEKLTDPGWLDGSSLAKFLAEQLNSGLVAFPFYEALMTSIFIPQAQILSWVVLLGQLLAGLAILVGCFTKVALVGGLFMNLNFLLAGVPNPSAFYLVIQMTLLLANAGAVFSVDAWLRRTAGRAGPMANRAHPHRARRARLLLTMLFCMVIAGGAATAISDFSPAGSVDDPAMIATIMACMAAAWAGLSYLRSVLPPLKEPSRAR